MDMTQQQNQVRRWPLLKQHTGRLGLASVVDDLSAPSFADVRAGRSLVPLRSGLRGGAEITPLDGASSYGNPFSMPGPSSAGGMGGMGGAGGFGGMGGNAGSIDASQASSFIAGLATPENISTAKSYVRAQATRVAYSAPMTTLQIVAGASIHIASTLGMVSPAAVLFHPRLVLPPYSQIYRAASSFLVIGLSTFDVIERMLGLAYWQAPLEQTFPRAIKAPLTPQQQQQHQQQQASKSPSVFRSVVDYCRAINPRFLQMQLVTAAVIVAVELSVFQNSRTRHDGVFLHLFPYTLYPVLEHAMRWLWAMTADERQSIVLFGILRLEPVMVPLATCALGGFGSLPSTGKGLFAAVVAARILDLRRWNGEPAVDWFWQVAKSWSEWVSSMVATVTASGRHPAARSQ
ncbi:hypothetical protein BC831DRAFT_460055 [Entophlyctis helioformis]|nr:hypothetical protein BC831DRAFT_460055 [Entophlyctis helioformis]